MVKLNKCQVIWKGKKRRSVTCSHYTHAKKLLLWKPWLAWLVLTHMWISFPSLRTWGWHKGLHEEFWPMTQTMTEQKVQLRFSSLLSFYCGDFGRGCMGGGGGTFNPAWITEWPPEVHLPLKSLRDSGWTWSEWETTQCFCDTSCLLPHHALVCLGLCFYFLSASTFQVSFTEMSASFIDAWCRGCASSSPAEGWTTWAVEAACLPYNPAVTTAWLYDLEWQFPHLYNVDNNTVSKTLHFLRGKNEGKITQKHTEEWYKASHW